MEGVNGHFPANLFAGRESEPTILTEQWARLATASDTLREIIRFKPRRFVEPTTIRSAFQSFACLRISLVVRPATTAAEISNPVSLNECTASLIAWCARSVPLSV